MKKTTPPSKIDRLIGEIERILGERRITDDGQVRRISNSIRNDPGISGIVNPKGH
ncbi:MAG TPA: hypothetical protein VMT62_11335 [Syntrophorhabdaceae bacterium]|nr:hypothetical protein [Syntrophorhabdaceae bacterium]